MRRRRHVLASAVFITRLSPPRVFNEYSYKCIIYFRKIIWIVLPKRRKKMLGMFLMTEKLCSPSIFYFFLDILIEKFF